MRCLKLSCWVLLSNCIYFEPHCPHQSGRKWASFASKWVLPVNQTHLLWMKGGASDEPPHRWCARSRKQWSGCLVQQTHPEAAAREQLIPRCCRARAKLEHAARNPPPLRWAGPEQPALWTDVLAEMSRHIYIRNKIGEGIQAPIFQVRACFLGNLHRNVEIFFIIFFF